MKILGIEFKNINSFAGEWEIRFDRPPLSDTGLFAIVGPNGSGKSSILDAITLGLYGETPRLKNPEAKITPWLADESYAAVTFSIGESQYRSEWRVRTRGGSLEAPEMRLTGINGGQSLLEDRIIRVRSRVAELTGLDFKRFCRSILLAQGEFAAFLTALENERAEILDKIIGPEMKRELELSIRSRAAEESEKLQQLKESAAGFAVFDGMRLNQAQQEQEQIRDELEEADRTLSELQELEAWLERLEQLEAGERGAEEAAAEAEGRRTELHQQLLLVQQAEPARPFAEAMSRLDQLISELEAMEDQLSRLNEQIPARKNRLGELDEQLQRNLVALEEARKHLDERGDDWSKAALRDRDIELQSERFLEAVRDLEATESGRKSRTQRESELDVQIAALTKELRSLERRLVDQAGDEGLIYDMAAIESGLKQLMDIQQQIKHQEAPRAELLKVERAAARELEQREKTVRKLREKANQLTRRRTEKAQRTSTLLQNKSLDHWTQLIKESQNKLSVCRELSKIGRQFREQQANGNAVERLHRVNSEIQTVSLSLARERARLNELAEDISWRDRVRQLADERTGLKEGRACPLCGSIDHPFVDQGAPDFSELDRTVQTQEKKIAGLQAQLDSFEATAAGLQVRANEMNRLQQLWTKTCEKAGLDWTVPDADLALAESRIQKVAIKDAKSRLRSARWQRWSTAWLGRAVLRKEAKLGRRELERDDVKKRYKLEQQALAAADGRIESLQREDRTIRSGLDAQLRDYRERTPAPGAEAALLHRLGKRLQNYRHLHEEQKATAGRLQSLENEKSALFDERRQLQEAAAVLSKEIEDLQGSLMELKTGRTALYGSMDPISEREAVESKIAACNKEQAALQQEIQSLRQLLMEEQAKFPRLSERAEEVRTELAELQRKLVEQAATAGFSSIEQVREQLELLEGEQWLKEQQLAAERVLADADSQATAVRRELETVRAERKTTDSIEVIQRRIEEQRKRCDILQESKQDVDRLLLDQRAAEREYREVQDAIAEQEKVWAEAMAEQNTLQTPDAPEIRARLQRLMLDRLIEYTNGYLSTLSGRYQLQTDDQNGLGFQVRDSLQGKSYRSSKTLSGGETFVVSLCLALGLSEMACKHREIESLFVDEGFGALDDESLYRVMTALKGLRDNGKMVGIISHVKRLADEFPTQIKVEKQLNGVSRLTIMA